MKRRILYVSTALITLLLSFPAIAQDSFSEPPITTNSISAVKLKDLNLQPGDYTIMQTITETSVVSVDHTKRGFTITSEEDGFMLRYKFVQVREDGKIYWRIDLVDWSGVVKMGYLANDVKVYTPTSAADVARRLAIYRLIDTASQKGADAIIDPIISMNMAKSGSLYYFKTTVSGRMIKLNER